MIARLPKTANRFETQSYRGARIEKNQHIIFTGEINTVTQKTKNVILAFGINNLQQSSTARIVRELIYGAQLFQSKFRKIDIHLATLIRRRDNPVLDKKIPAIKTLLKGKCGKLGIGLFNVNNTFEHKGQPADPKHYHDGLHLSSLGLKKYQQTLNNFALQNQPRGIVKLLQYSHEHHMICSTAQHQCTEYKVNRHTIDAVY